MHEVSELFDKRSDVGAKIKQILAERKSTKTELCSGTGISRPTIDKILEGTTTSRINYEKYMKKILSYFEMTPDMLIGNGNEQYSWVKNLRKLRQLSLEKVAAETGISLNRLKEIEEGGEASLAELRDIARSFSISVNVLLNKNYFDAQVAEMDYFIRDNKNKDTEMLSGFWGHVGILLKNKKEYLWFPVTSNTRELVYKTIERERLVIPCMNNKVLYLYMPNVKEIVLLDEACDQPSFANWDSGVSCGEIPLVVYEALEDYLWDVQDTQKEVLSTEFRKYLDAVIKNEKWSEDDICNIVNYGTIYYEDGRTRAVNIDFEQVNETVSDEISNAYEWDDSEFSEEIVFFIDSEDVENFIKVKNVSMIELPLVKVENAIIREWEA